MRVMLPALALLVAACGGADKAADAAAEETGDKAGLPAGELAELEGAISDSTVAEVVADDPAGRLAEAPAGPAMADPLATPMPEAPVAEAPVAEAPAAGPKGSEPPAPAGG
jgi:hypothetical protein